MMLKQSIIFAIITLTLADPYLVLKIEPKSDLKTVKEAFRKLSKLYHPDKSVEN